MITLKSPIPCPYCKAVLGVKPAMGTQKVTCHSCSAVVDVEIDANDLSQYIEHADSAINHSDSYSKDKLKARNWKKVIACNAVGLLCCCAVLYWAFNERPRIDPAAIGICGILGYSIPTGITFLLWSLISAPKLEERIKESSIRACPFAVVSGLLVGAKAGIPGGIIATIVLFPLVIAIQLVLVSDDKKYKPNRDPVEPEKVKRDGRLMLIAIWGTVAILFICLTIYTVATLVHMNMNSDK